MTDHELDLEHHLSTAEKVSAILIHVQYLRRTSDDHGKRLTDLEGFTNRAKGVLAFLTLVTTVSGGVLLKSVLGG
jgi:hypothetical protein